MKDPVLDLLFQDKFRLERELEAAMRKVEMIARDLREVRISIYKQENILNENFVKHAD